MNVYKKIIHVFVVIVISQCLIAETKYKTKKKLSKKAIKRKHKGRKQFFPTGFPSTYPSQYPGLYNNNIPQYNIGAKKVRFAKGFPPAFDCTRAQYGCCWDGRTPAHGVKGKGCPQCRDVYKDFCEKTKKLCHFPMVADYCRITCKLCITGEKKKKSCQSNKYNCCWDGSTSAKGPRGKGCPKIKDKLTNGECDKFEAECLRNPYYMWTNCRASCLKNLPLIQPYLQMFSHGPSASDYHTSTQTSYGHPTMPHGIPPYPGLPHGNFTAGKKTSSKTPSKLKVKKT